MVNPGKMSLYKDDEREKRKFGIERKVNEHKLGSI